MLILALRCVCLCLLSLHRGYSAAGDPGEVTLLAPEMVSRNFRFLFPTTAGHSYPIEVSSDLKNWSLLTNVVGTGEIHLLQDNEPANFSARFYHVGVARAVPPTPIPNMVYILPGTFTMGSPATEAGRGANEGPQTVVTISRGFWMGQFEVIQAHYQALTGAIDSNFPNPNFAVDFAHWSNATNYCQKLTEREIANGHLPPGYLYRLPTEAEWEYACRAGNSTPFGVGAGVSLNSNQANFDGGFPYGGALTGPYRKTSAPVGSFAPNAWGLYDMHGNMWEWCQDLIAPYPGGSVTDPLGATTGSSRVLRGGGFNSAGVGCRSAKRDSRGPTFRNFGQGFRVVLAQVP